MADMEASKTTPGPWHWRGKDEELETCTGLFRVAPSDAKYPESGDYEICSGLGCEWGVMGLPSPADARLIEKAPEMYEALRIFAEIFANPDREGDMVDLLAVQQDCLNIIRYVEGEDDGLDR